ncbi:TolB family protein [Micromonospora sp. KLBMP9576]|uniref:TolB family protein n=1 Tax=Micromonospora sp. KLBMP9576 TaxID=3424769 RepID=UPI003D944B0D
MPEETQAEPTVGDERGSRPAPPAGLPRRADPRGPVPRRRRRSAVAGGALAVLVALGGSYLWLRPGEARETGSWAPAGTPAAAPATPSAGTAARAPAGDWTRAVLTLPGDWVLTGATSTGEPAEQGYALDRDRGRYAAPDRRYEQVWAAPRGGIAAVVDHARRGEIGLLALRSGTVRWIRTGNHIMNPHWSPDGRRLALTLLDEESGGFSLGVLTAASGAYRTFPVDTDRYLCTDHCFFTWGRDGRHVALQQTAPGSPLAESRPHARRGVQFFSATNGRPTRFVPVPGDPAGPWSWSPDGRLVVLKGQDGPLLAEVATGRVIGPAPAADAVWVADDRLLHRDRGSNEMVLVDLGGRERARRALPAVLGADMVISVAPR